MKWLKVDAIGLLMTFWVESLEELILIATVSTLTDWPATHIVHMSPSKALFQSSFSVRFPAPAPTTHRLSASFVYNRKIWLHFFPDFLRTAQLYYFFPLFPAGTWFCARIFTFNSFPAIGLKILLPFEANWVWCRSRMWVASVAA